MALLYSLRGVVRRGVHHGLDLSDGREKWVTSSSNAVTEFREEENHSSSWVGEGREGAGGMRKLSRWERRPSQSVKSYGDQDGNMVRDCRGEDRGVPG